MSLACGPSAASVLLRVAFLATALVGCATTYAPERLAVPAELRDVRSKTAGGVTVSVSILTDELARRRFGADLREHELQALWLQVRNDTDRRLWFIRNLLDPDFYSAEEAAQLLERDVPRDSRASLHQDLRDASMRVMLLPRAITEGFVFLPRVEGGRYVDIRLQGDVYSEDASRTTDAPRSPAAGVPSAPTRELRFEFALPLPDGDFDYERLDTWRTYAGRTQDVAMQRARRSISQRHHLRLWLAPYRFEDRPVWIGLVSRDIGVKVTSKSPTFTTHVIDPGIDATREYLLHSLIAQGFVDRFGFGKGSAQATPDQPRVNLTGDPYYSDGLRLVVVLAPEPIPPDRIRSLLWEQSAPPIAEGQSDAARRNVRPIEPQPTIRQ